MYIKPPVDDFGIADFKAYERLIEIGHVHTRATLEAWLASDGAPTSVTATRTGATASRSGR